MVGVDNIRSSDLTPPSSDVTAAGRAVKSTVSPCRVVRDRTAYIVWTRLDRRRTRNNNIVVAASSVA